MVLRQHKDEATDETSMCCYVVRFRNNLVAEGGKSLASFSPLFPVHTKVTSGVKKQSSDVEGVEPVCNEACNEMA
jgi:hypothetical protein